MAKKWLDSIEKQSRSDVCDRQMDRRTESTTKNRLGAEINDPWESALRVTVTARLSVCLSVCLSYAPKLLQLKFLIDLAHVTTSKAGKPFS